jgi:hypothetical protein
VPSPWGNFREASAVVGSLVNPTGSPAVLSDNRIMIVTDGQFFGEKMARSYRDINSNPIADESRSLGFNNSLTPSLSAQGNRWTLTRHTGVNLFTGFPADADNIARFGGTSTACLSSAVEIPQSAYLTPQGRLIVADTFHHRVLIWHPESVLNSGTLSAPDVVVGQSTLTRCVANDDDQRDGGGSDATDRVLNSPHSVWSDDQKLIIADTGNNRILVWNDLPAGSFERADVVIGQSSPTLSEPNAGQPTPSAATLASPVAVDVSARGELAVADRLNNRILIWNSIPLTTGQAAQHVIGQRDFSSGAQNAGQEVATTSTLHNPLGVRFHDRKLIVVDNRNGRVLIWQAAD